MTPVGRPPAREVAGRGDGSFSRRSSLSWVSSASLQRRDPARRNLPSRRRRTRPAVRDIVVEGNRRIQAPAILNRVQTKIGDPLSPAALRDDVRSIFGLGFFDDVQVRTEEFEGGVRVIFAVVERPAPAGGQLRGELGAQQRRAAGEGRHPGRRPLQPGRGPEGRGGHPPEVRGRGVLRRPDHPAHRAHAGGRPAGGVPDRGRAQALHRPHRDRGEQGAHRRPDQGRDVDQGAHLLDLPVLDRAAQGLRRRRRPHPPALRRPRLHPGPRRVHGDRARPRAQEGHAARPRRWRGRSSGPAPSRSRATRSSPTEEVRKLVRLQEGEVFNRGALRNSVAGHGGPLLRARPGAGRGRAPDDERPGEPQGRRDHSDRRGRAGLRRADQHQRQHEELGEGAAAGAAGGRGRAVHLPEARAKPPAAVQPGLLRRGERHHRAGDHARQDRREHRRQGAGDRRVQHRRGLQQPGQPVRHPRREPAEPVRPGPGGLPPVPHRRRRAGWAWSASPSPTSSTSRSAPGSTSTTASGSTTTSRRSGSAATSGPATRSPST